MNTNKERIIQEALFKKHLTFLKPFIRCHSNRKLFCKYCCAFLNDKKQVSVTKDSAVDLLSPTCYRRTWPHVTCAVSLIKARVCQSQIGLKVCIVKGIKIMLADISYIDAAYQNNFDVLRTSSRT